MLKLDLCYDLRVLLEKKNSFGNSFHKRGIFLGFLFIYYELELEKESPFEPLLVDYQKALTHAIWSKFSSEAKVLWWKAKFSIWKQEQDC